MPDIFTKVFSGIASALRNPVYAVIVLLIVLFFPLDLLDYLVWIIISIMAVVINAVLWILVGITNAIISIINWIKDVVVGAINAIPLINVGSPPDFDPFPYVKIAFADIEVNMFASGTSLLTIILSLVGISFPLW